MTEESNTGACFELGSLERRLLPRELLTDWAEIPEIGQIRRRSRGSRSGCALTVRLHSVIGKHEARE